MKPTRWRRKRNDWDDCVDYRAHERRDREREAQEEINMELDKPQYAQGGFIGRPPEGGGVPFMLSRGHTLMSYASYKALGAKGLKELFPNSDIEIVFTADDVREYGTAALEKLQQELGGDGL